MPRHFLTQADGVRARLDGAGWSATSGWDFDLYWRPQVPARAAFASLPSGARVNHIPGVGAITSPRLTGRASLEPADLSCFVLIAGVDPLRVFVHAELDEAIDRLVVATILEGRDAMTRAVRDLLVDRDACFELLRFDFARAAEGRRRVLRCVLSPPLDDHPRVVDDALRLVGIHPAAPRGDASAELARAGGFRRVAPAPHTNDLIASAPLPRWSDLALTPSIAFVPRLELRAGRGFAGKRLVLFAPSTQRFYVCNQVAAYVWLRLEDGATLDEISEDIQGQFSISLDRARSDVWDLAARWAHDGLVVRSPPDAATCEASSPSGDRKVIEIPGVAVARGDACVVLAGDPSLGGAAIAALLRCALASGTLRVDRETGAPLPSTAAPGSPCGLEISELDERGVAEARPGFMALPTYVLPSELLARFVPFDPPPPDARSHLNVGALVIVRRTASDAPAVLTPIDAAEAFEALVHLGLSMRPPMGVEETEHFFAWINDLPAFTLDMGGDLASAVARVDDLLRRGDCR